MEAVLPVVAAVINLGMMAALMWRLDRELFLLALLAAPALCVLIWALNRSMTERTYQKHQLEGETIAFAERTLTTIPVVQAFGREEYDAERFRSLCRRTRHAELRAAMSQMQFQVGTAGVTALGTAAIMVLGGLHVLNGSLTVGGLLVFLSYLSSLYAPLESLAFASMGFAAAAAGARRVLEVLDAKEEVAEVPGAVAVAGAGGRGRGEVRLEGVSFGYEPGRPVLHQIWLEAHPGETVALVGATGAGKSTLVSLVPRFCDPWEGRVTFDGVDLRGLQLKSLRAQISLVLQEPFLLPLTVAENIAYGRPEATQPEIERAARAAHAEEFIRRLPADYDTVIGERGATLSGGQRQRLAIARALLKDAPVLILDEPTAALDAETEVGLLAALEQLMRGRTTFLIAHRLSTIRRADRIVVLDQGRVVEMGTEPELLAAGGAYHRFHSLQFGRPRPSAGEAA
jgi:ATP-binding cassette subfamily B protein/subfamily B ATP-binding cassette protein MsbA